jgi:hypothetical protein
MSIAASAPSPDSAIPIAPSVDSGNAQVDAAVDSWPEPHISITSAIEHDEPGEGDNGREREEWRRYAPGRQLNGNRVERSVYISPGDAIRIKLIFIN